MIHQKRKNSNRRLVLVAIALTAQLLPINSYCAPGDLYETDLATGTVFKFAPDGTQSTFVSGLMTPIGVGFDGKGNTFISEAGAGAVLKIAPDGSNRIR